jgi:hypothetical protein
VHSRSVLWLSNMAADGGNIFVYLGGEQEVPFGVTHAIIDPSVKIVLRDSFRYRQRLVSVLFHDGVELIEEGAFQYCKSLRGIKLHGVREIGERAFSGCFALSDVEFGDNLETVGRNAFGDCNSLKSIKIPSVRTLEDGAFGGCDAVIVMELGANLERLETNSFYNCFNLQRIVIPLKEILFLLDPIEQYNQFHHCVHLKTVDVVGAEGLRKTISSLLMESWRNEMNGEIDRINRELPNTLHNEKTNAIRQWISSVINRMDHYKAEHNRLLKEHMTQLELAIWKTRLDAEEEDDNSTQEVQSNKANTDTDCVRKGKRITSGAHAIIKNVLPFLELA